MESSSAFDEAAAAVAKEPKAAAVVPAIVDDIEEEEEEEYVRADEIDLKSLDFQLEEQHAAKAFGKRQSGAVAGDCDCVPKEAWEIDLSKLEVGRVISPGTYGTVFHGVYDGQEVAVKLLDWGEDGFSSEAQTDSLRALFKTEVAVWHVLDHPNVTKFIGASMGTTNLKIPVQDSNSSEVGRTAMPDRACCFVVEYLGGGTLKQYLINHITKKLPFREVVRLALDLARGLSYLHSKKIVHRDVKTSNMLLDTQHNLKIADFGVARVEAENLGEMTGVTGTPSYMAPEVYDGKPYDRSCDVYSFGICLWEIYCCDMPYADLSFAEISTAVVHENRRPEIPRCCPVAMANIMRRCWATDPKERPHMEEVVRLLEALDTTKGGGMVPEVKPRGCFCLFRRPVRGA